MLRTFLCWFCGWLAQGTNRLWDPPTPNNLIFFLEEYLQVEKPGLPDAQVMLAVKEFQAVKHLELQISKY